MTLPQPIPAPDPAHVFSVGELTRRVKALLERGLPEAWVRGEISNLRRQPSGHVYFTLKDAESQVPCVLFRAEALRSAADLRDGAQLLVFGQVSVYEPRGAYQLIVRWVLEDGAGRLRQEFERLKARLAAEGLFDAERKRPLPARPRTIGFITSPGGAALRDFISILRRRGWRGRLVVLPAKVQGAEAAREMITQLDTAARLGLFDLLVIGRGGGGIEDLWAFNEEPLVRAVAAAPAPIISAVGHETDFTLCDFAADRRAETPSAAAELISSAHIELADNLATAARALSAAGETYVERHRAGLELLRHRWRASSPRNFIEQASLRLDEGSARLRLALRRSLHARRTALHEVSAQFASLSPAARLAVARERAGACIARLTRVRASALAPRHAAVAQYEQRLAAAGVDRVLARGFVILSDDEGRFVTRRAQVRPMLRLRARFADGETPLVATGASAIRVQTQAPPEQSSLALE